MAQIPLTPKKQQHGSYLAYIYATLSNISLVLMQLTFKQLTAYASPPYVLAFRGSILFFFNFYLLRRSAMDFHVRDPIIFRMLMKRSLVNYAGVALYLCSIKYIPLGIANALHNTSPIMTFFIELFYYKKVKIQWMNLMVIFVCFTGILFITQPQFIFGDTNSSVQQKSSNIFYLFVLTAAFTNSLSMIFLHDLRDKCHQLIALQYVYTFQSCLNYTFFIAVIGTNQQAYTKIHSISLKQSFMILVLIFFLVILAFLGQYFKVKSVYMCSPALIMPFNYLTVILGLLIDLVVFDSHYNWMIIMGMALASCGLLSKFIMIKFQK